MRKVPLFFFFCLALVGAVVPLPLSPFAPFLAIAYYLSPLSKAVWISLGCGFLLDLLSSEFRFGLYSVAFVLTTLVLYKQKRHFFEDKPVALSLFSTIISSISTLIVLLLTHLFDRGVPITSQLVMTDLFLLPLCDGLYAFLWFTCPMRLYSYIREWFRTKASSIFGIILAYFRSK